MFNEMSNMNQRQRTSDDKSEFDASKAALPLTNGHGTPQKRKRIAEDYPVLENGSTEYIHLNYVDENTIVSSKRKCEESKYSCSTPSKASPNISNKALTSAADQSLSFSPADSELSNCSCESDKFIVYKPEDSYLYMNLSAEARDQAEWGDCILTTNRRRTRSNSVCDVSGKGGKISNTDGKASSKGDKVSSKGGKVSNKGGKTSGKGGKNSGKEGKDASRNLSKSINLSSTDIPSGRVSPGYLQACLLNATSEELPVNLDTSLPRRETRSLSVK